MDLVKRYVLPAILCVALTIVVWLGLNVGRTLYNDHVVLAQIVNMINQEAAQAKAVAQPEVPKK